MALTRINNQSLTNVTSAGLPSGTVLQVVSDTDTATLTVTNDSTWHATGLVASITPSSASSKILILMHGNMYSTAANYQGAVTVFRGTTSGTNLGDASFGLGTAFDAGNANKGHISCSYLDSPSTTSAQTYTVAIKTDGVNGGIFNVNNEVSTLVLMEIAG